MSIQDSFAQRARAFATAHRDFPFKSPYPYKPEACNHEYSFVVFCDGGDYDIVRCQKCGAETICVCDFDDEYD